MIPQLIIYLIKGKMNNFSKEEDNMYKEEIE